MRAKALLRLVNQRVPGATPQQHSTSWGDAPGTLLRSVVLALFVIGLAMDASWAQEQGAKSQAGGSAEGKSQPAGEEQAATIPKVSLSSAHAALCKVKVGDTLPDVELPAVNGGGQANLSSLFGAKATVVVFWKSDRRMAREQLADMGPEVVGPFGKAGVSVVGIAVSESAESAQAALDAAEASFPNLLDADGKAFAQVGSEKLPRTYVVDPRGKIVWFDIEYSMATRRELNQTLRALTGAK